MTSVTSAATDPLSVFLQNAVPHEKVPIPLQSTAFDITIEAGLAVVSTTRLFRNVEASTIEATLTFPVPVHAVLFRLDVRIGDRRLQASAKAKEAARRTYEEGIEDGNVFSFLHRETMIPIEFKEGGAITLPVAAPAPVVPAVVPAPIVRERQPTRATKVARPQEPRGDLTAGEMEHFHSAQINVAELCSRLEPTIKAYARQGTRKPRDVVHRLNQDGHKTANGSQWTTRLVYFLLKLIFNNSPGTERQNHQQTSSQRTDTPLTHATFTKDEIARRLEALGRVSIQTDG